MAEIEKKAGEEKKSSKKLVIIIAAVLVLLAVGGGAAFYFLKSDSNQAGVEETSQQEEEKTPKEVFYFDMSKPLIVDFSKESAIRLIQISVSFLVEETSAVDGLKKHEPMIRNNLLMMIGAQGAESLKTYEGKDALREAMLNEVNQILKKMVGKGQVKEVFFTAFVMQ